MNEERERGGPEGKGKESKGEEDMGEQAKKKEKNNKEQNEEDAKEEDEEHFLFASGNTFRLTVSEYLCPTLFQMCKATSSVAASPASRGMAHSPRQSLCDVAPAQQMSQLKELLSHCATEGILIENQLTALLGFIAVSLTL